jgi:hypothetical protein
VQKLRKFLTNPKYRLLLETIGLSQEPLLGFQIKNKMGNRKDKYVYVMMDELIPVRHSAELLFRWDKISDKKVLYNYRVIKKLNDIFKLRWAIKDTDYQYVSDNVSFVRSRDNKTITISHGSDSKLIITINSKQKDETANLKIITATGHKMKENPLIIKKKNNKLYVYVEILRNLKPVKYLSATDKRVERSISEIRRQIQSSHSHLSESELANLPDVSNVRSDITNWKFRLNIRGLILYILAEVELEKQKKGNADKKSRIHNVRISKVLENLSKNYSDEFTFLLYYTEFKREYERLGQVKELSGTYQLNLMREIAEELRYQIQTASTSFLMYWVTKRYSEEVTRHFTNSVKLKMGLVNETFLNLSYMKLKDYQLRTFKIMKDYLQFEYDMIKNNYDFVSEKDKLLTYIPV